MDGKGHPLPASDEARHGEIPESLVEEKGYGDDPSAVVQPADEAVNPDGEPYPSQRPEAEDEGLVHPPEPGRSQGLS